jgi:tRNA(fMet)-specific endonuclease VapC
MNSAVLDTDVASFLLKWHPDYAASYSLLIRGARLQLSFMTVAELRAGAFQASWGERRLQVLEAYLSDFEIVFPDDSVCTLFAKARSNGFRKGKVVDVADAWIAATALYLRAPLVTHNTSDYTHVEGLDTRTLPR